MSRIAFPYVLLLAVLLFSIGLYGALSRTMTKGISRGIFLMLSGVAVGLLGFVAVLPDYYVKRWPGYGILIVVLASMVRYGRKV